MNDEKYVPTPIEEVKTDGNSDGNWNSQIDRMPTVFTAYDGFCIKHIIDTTNISQEDPFYSHIMCGIQNAAEIQVIISDTDSNLHYMINPHTVKGEPIKHGYSYSKYYGISFEEIHRLEESGDCTNYREGAKFKTYADCVSHEQEQTFKPLLGGCMVPWLAALDSPGICKGKIQYGTNGTIFDRLMKEFEKFWERVTISSSAPTKACLMPCVELQAHSTLTRSKPDFVGYDIYLEFKKTVKVTKYQKAYGLFDLVVEVGSSLGLWIGLSALGVFDLLATGVGYLHQTEAGEHFLKRKRPIPS